MDKEKLNKVFEYFEGMNIQLPNPVKTSLEDVFEENDNIEDVQCYYKDEIDDFQSDMRLKREITIYKEGQSKGFDCSPITYYGQIDYSLSENIKIVKKLKNGDEELINQIIDNDMSDTPSCVYDSNEYEVVLLETISWITPDEPEVHDKLYIYCPVLIKEEADNA